MSLNLYMVGVIVADMARAVEFYRRLGVAFADGSEGLEHAEVKMNGVTFFLNTRRSNAKWDPTPRDPPQGGYRIILEFSLHSREALETKFNELVAHGYGVHCPPYDVSPELRFAMIDDPDGNTILLSASNDG